NVRSQANERLTVGSVPWRVRPESASEVEATSISALLECEDRTLLVWYRSLTHLAREGAYDSHHRTAGVAGRTRRRGGRLAVRCGRAAVQPDAADWRAHVPIRRRSGFTGLRGCICAGAAGLRLDRGPQHSDRLPLGRRRP